MHALLSRLRPRRRGPAAGPGDGDASRSNPPDDPGSRPTRPHLLPAHLASRHLTRPEHPAGAPVDLDAAIDAARTGDVWIFRGHSRADRAIRLATNAPVNHVGMAVVLDDLPPMMWHAELGRSLPDLWTGDHHRGVQLHDLRAAVQRWTVRYEQDAWLRQLSPEVGREAEDAVLRTIARWDGVSFPTTAALGWRWLRGRRWSLPQGPLARRVLARERSLSRDDETRRGDAMSHVTETRGAAQAPPAAAAAYCAEVVAVTYEAMGLLDPRRPAHWYDPGRFWSGDHLDLTPGWTLGAEIAVRVPGAPGVPGVPGAPGARPARRPRWRLPDRRHTTRRGG